MFDKFEVIDCLKKDEYAGVYLARHIYLNKNIILKCLNTKTVPDDSVVERFKREAKILAHLDHPNIIKVLDFGTHDNFFYISFEYFQGSSLREVIKENKTNITQKKEILVQILQGLTEAHNNGIIHRDIKPENIFVDANNRVKIGDFGLALSKAESFVTSKNAIVGTPCYMSPEQISGEKLTTQSDMFSLGVVIYELYTQNNPFLGNDVSESINNILSKDYKKLLLDAEKLPEEIRQLLNILLIRNLAGRAKTTIECLNLLGVEFITPGNYSTLSLPKLSESKTNYKKLSATLGVIFFIIIAVYFLLIKPGNEKIVEPTESDLPNNQTVVDSGVNRNIETPNFEKKNENDSELPDEKINPENIAIKNNEATDLQPNNETTTTVNRTGYVDIECSPWAKIVIDSTEYDTTPIEKPIELPVGEHRLVLTHPQYPKYERLLKILADQTIAVKVSLDTLYGYLDCKVFPWGDLYINNKHIGQTPLSTPLKLVPGKYTLQILNPNFDAIKDTVNIKRNKTRTVQYSFKK